jgi:hypothetical protein
MIRLIGYWKASFDDEYPLPQELETEYAPETRRKLVTYLESGSLLVQYRGASWCRWCCANNGTKELYDGDWAWPEGLAHYLQHHPVALPPDFVRRATTQAGPRRPAGDPKERLAELDDSHWIDWARPFRTPAVARMLDEARAAAHASYQVQLDAHASEMAAKLGVLEKSCAWAGCEGRALVGKALCARHAATNDHNWLLSQVEHLELNKFVRQLPDLLARKPS